MIGWLIARYDWRSPFVLVGGWGGWSWPRSCTSSLVRRGPAPLRQMAGHSGCPTPTSRHLGSRPFWGAGYGRPRNHLYCLWWLDGRAVWPEPDQSGAGGNGHRCVPSEFTGEPFAGWSTDRFGKRPVTITAAFLTAIAYALLPFAQGNLTLALITMFGLFFCFSADRCGQYAVVDGRKIPGAEPGDVGVYCRRSVGPGHRRAGSLVAGAGRVYG